MSRGPKVSKDYQLIIAEIYMEHPKWQAKDIQREANRKLHGKGPGLSYIQKFMAEKRKEGGLDTSTDTPWSLGLSATYQIPPEANQDLMKIWKWCTMVGMTFTIREAQWVARLRNLVPFPRLYSHAILYARRERACQFLGWESKIFTTDLDMHIALPYESGGLTPYDLEAEWMSSITWQLVRGMYDSQNKLTSLIKDEYEAGYWGKDILVNFMNSPTSWIVQRYLGLLPQHRQTLSENGDIVYTVWLRLFANGMKWKRMPVETRNRIADQLYEEVGLTIKEIDKFTIAVGDYKTTAEALKDEAFKKQMKFIRQCKAWKPSEKLLQEVGISEKETEWKLVTYESERPGKIPLLEQEQIQAILLTQVASRWPALGEILFPEEIKED